MTRLPVPETPAKPGGNSAHDLIGREFADCRVRMPQVRERIRTRFDLDPAGGVIEHRRICGEVLPAAVVVGDRRWMSTRAGRAAALTIRFRRHA
jgi:hypothetical protein